MKNSTPSKGELIRGYNRFSKSWYATDKDIERSTIMVGEYYPEGGTAGEVSVEWETIKDKKVPVLTAYDDSWKTLSKFGDLIKAMAGWDNKNISEAQFARLLDRTGFIDLTQYKQKLNPGKQPRVVLPIKNKGLKK